MPTWRHLPLITTPATNRVLPVDDDTTFEPPHDEADQPLEAAVVSSAIYRSGERIEVPQSLAASKNLLTKMLEQDDAGATFAWIGLTHPTDRQVQACAEVFGLHPLAVEDAIVAHQRPKLERYGDTLFLVLRPATYDDETETVKFGEVHAFIGTNFVLTVRHSNRPSLAPVRERFEANPSLLRLGTQAVLYGLLDFVVDGYAPVLAGLENDIDEIEAQVFESDPNVSRRIYELSQEVMQLQRAVRPLQGILRGLELGAEKHHTPDEVITALRDVLDHTTSIVERVEGFRQSLSEILQLNAILVAQTQNEEMKRLALVANNQADEVKRASSWAAILFAPTIVAGIYGMNFDRMPELHWFFGYPFALLLMFAVSLSMWLLFKRKNWL